MGRLAKLQLATLTRREWADPPARVGDELPEAAPRSIAPPAPRRHCRSSATVCARLGGPPVRLVASNRAETPADVPRRRSSVLPARRQEAGRWREGMECRAPTHLSAVGRHCQPIQRPGIPFRPVKAAGAPILPPSTIPRFIWFHVDFEEYAPGVPFAQQARDDEEALAPLGEAESQRVDLAVGPRVAELGQAVQDDLHPDPAPEVAHERDVLKNNPARPCHPAPSFKESEDVTDQTRATAVDALSLTGLTKVLTRKSGGEKVEPIWETGRQLGTRDVHGHSRVGKGTIVVIPFASCSEYCPSVRHQLAE